TLIATNLYFENRHKLQPIKKDSTIKVAILKTYQKNLELLTNSGRPQGSQYYEKILATDYRINQSIENYSVAAEYFRKVLEMLNGYTDEPSIQLQKDAKEKLDQIYHQKP
ncbi:MAG: hypothetical protein QME68_04080, partial [Elusimicrobiota bacterium]|nr:hypothetical protein [Elusimicrobiota bacterium]